MSADRIEELRREIVSVAAAWQLALITGDATDGAGDYLGDLIHEREQLRREQDAEVSS